MNTPSFNNHLDQKDKVTQVLDLTNPDPDTQKAEATLAFIWNTLFNFSQNNPDISCDKLNTISSIVYKLKSLEIKSRELSIKEEKHKTQNDQAQAALSAQNDPKGLSPETLRLIEEQLNLL